MLTPPLESADDRPAEPATAPAAGPAKGSGTGSELAGATPLGVGLLLVLAAGHFSSALSRNLPSVVAVDLQTTFGLDDAGFGLLHGPAFVAVNVVGMIVAAKFIDRLDRFRVMAGCMVGWSLGSLVFALAGSLEQLVAARILVGLSQAAFAPCAVSLIIDRGGAGFSRRLSVFTIGSALGRSAGVVLAGAVVALVATAPAWLAGELADWRLAYALLSLPSLGLAAVLFALQDRRPPSFSRPARLVDTIAWVWRRRSQLAPYLLASCAVILIGQATTAWMPSVFRRVLDADTAQAALLAGAAVLVGAPIGHAAGGLALDRWTSAGRSPPALMGAALLAVIAMGVALAFSQSVVALFLAACGLAMALGMGGLVALAGFQPVTPAERRGAVTALYLAAVSLAGMGLGPPMVGLVSQQAFGAGAGLLPAVALVVVASASIGVLAAWRSAAVWRSGVPADD